MPSHDDNPLSDLRNEGPSGASSGRKRKKHSRRNSAVTDNAADQQHLELEVEDEGEEQQQPPEGGGESEAEEEGERPKKKRAKDRNVVFRLMVPFKMAGKVIGKQGALIQKLREDTGARITVTDPVNLQNAEERVILLSSKDEARQQLCAAEKALTEVANIILETDTEKGEGSSSGVKVCLLVADSQAGSIIGKAGVVINGIRESSGADIRVLSSQHTPMCASTSKTDRLVQIHGEATDVQKALGLLAATLRANPPRKVVSLEMKPPLLVLTNAPVSKTSIEMSFPSWQFGKIFGKGGATIKRIRQQTRAFINVNDLGDGALERVIVLQGTPAQVAAAQKLVQASLKSKQK